MARWWLCGGCVFPLVVKPLILTFKCLIWPWRSRSIASSTIGILTKIFGHPSLNRWGVMMQTSSKWGKIGFDVKFDLEGQCRSFYKITGIIIKVFTPVIWNLVIWTWTGDELSCGQARGWRTDGSMDARTDRRRQRQYPEARLASSKKLRKTCRCSLNDWTYMILRNVKYIQNPANPCSSFQSLMTFNSHVR